MIVYFIIEAKWSLFAIYWNNIGVLENFSVFSQELINLNYSFVVVNLGLGQFLTYFAYFVDCLHDVCCWLLQFHRISLSNNYLWNCTYFRCIYRYKIDKRGCSLRLLNIFFSFNDNLIIVYIDICSNLKSFIFNINPNNIIYNIFFFDWFFQYLVRFINSIFTIFIV